MKGPLWRLRPEKLERLSEILGRSNDFGEAKARWMAATCYLEIFERHLPLRGNRRRRKKALKKLLDQMWTDRVMDCFELVDEAEPAPPGSFDEVIELLKEQENGIEENCEENV